MSEPYAYHIPVLLEEVIRLLPHKSDGVFLDGTLGGGGHFRAMAEMLDAAGTLIGIDRDPEAVVWNRDRMGSCRPAVILEQAKFSEFDRVLQQHRISSLDAILLDLGVSSHQIDSPARGFSYLQEGDLDMRMDPGAGVPAYELIRRGSVAELASILHDFGEVHGADRIAAAIKNWSCLRTSADLRACCMKTFGDHLSIKLLAKIFQALRIAVNDELGELQRFCAKVLDFLKPGGRLAVISYHSLEDRMVKNFMRKNEQTCICPPEAPRCVCNRVPLFKRVTGKTIRPSPKEIADNRRSRSARLRAVERTGAAR